MKTKHKVLILQGESDQNDTVTCNLEKEGFLIIGPFKTTADAYVAVLKEEPDFAIIDADISLEKTNSLSNTLIQLNIEHLILLKGSTQILKRRLNHGILRGVISGAHINMASGICSELLTLQTNASRGSGHTEGDDKLTV